MRNPKNHRPAESFFGALASDSQRENRFSRIFAACFQESSFVKRQVLDQFYSTCRIRTGKGALDGWHCKLELPPPSLRGGRTDICLLSGDTPVFYVESKLQANLTLEQLRRYRKQGVRYLIAITRNRPEVNSADLKKAGIFTLRWQDIHRRLLAERPTAPRDKFIRDSLTTYMEELEMAHKEKVTAKDFEGCHKFFSAVSSACRDGLAPRSGFLEIHACLNLLQDLRAEMIEHNPDLAKRLPNCSGPGYYNFVLEGTKYNVLGWTRHKGWSAKSQKYGCGLRFPSDGSPSVLYSSWGDNYKEREVAKLISGRNSNTVEIFCKVLTSDWRRWNA